MDGHPAGWLDNARTDGHHSRWSPRVHRSGGAIAIAATGGPAVTQHRTESCMSAKAVQWRLHGDTAVLRLNRPRTHNAVNDAMMDGFESALRVLDADRRVRFLILTGAGRRTFCAGGDLHYFATQKTTVQGRRLSRRMQRILDRLSRGQRLVIAAINGQTIGGGCEIMLAAHFRIASARATFCFRQAANGLTTAWGGGVRLFQLVGPARALRLLVTAERISAHEALRLGLVDAVVPHGRVLDEARRWTSSIARHSRGAIGAFLRLHAACRRGPFARAAAIEADGLATSWISDDFRATLRQFA